MFVVLIAWVILTTWFVSWYKFFLNVQEKSISNSIRDKINENITANDVWRWITTNRIKYNILLFRNWENFVDNYYYTEVYTLDPITSVISSIPTPQFYWKERIEFPDQVDFIITSPIEWTNLLVDTETNDFILWIKRELPNSTISAFDANITNFQRIPEIREQTFRSDFTYWKWYKDLVIGEAIDDVTYYDIVKWQTPVMFNNIQIRVEYKWKYIGDIVMDTVINKFVYVDRRSENIINN